ncbi:MAG: DinB family protein [Gemmatimonadales bacterium]
MSQRDMLMESLDRAYNSRSWHGTNLRGSLRGLSLAQATWRPGRGRHNIWELVVHAAYWKYVVWRRLTGRKRGSFPLEGSNWFRRLETSPSAGSNRERAWRQDLALLDQMHEELRKAVARIPNRKLDRRAPGPGTFSNLAMILGVAAHDLYHAGQIQLLKRLYEGKR